MWWAITGAIYNAGAGAVIIGGLYWKKGTTAGAWTSMVLGSTIAVVAILLDYNWTTIAPWCQAHWGLQLPARMWLNPQWHAFIVMCISASSYVIVSWLTCKGDFNMDWLLKRGQYRVAVDHEGEDETHKVSILQKLIGIDKLFTRGDKFVAGFISWWSLLLVVLNGGLVAWHYGLKSIKPEWVMSNHAWAVFWLWYGLIIPFIFAAITLIWFGIGGMIDLKHFFHTLRTMKRDVHDDGSVPHRHNPADEPTGTDSQPSNKSTS